MPITFHGQSLVVKKPIIFCWLWLFSVYSEKPQGLVCTHPVGDFEYVEDGMIAF
jgi:hypothetical protein